MEITKDILYNYYITQNLSAKEIALIWGYKSANTIYNKLKLYNIERKSNSEAQKKIVLNYDDISYQYHVRLLSGSEIAKQMNCTDSTIYRFMEKHNIKRREKTENFGGHNKGVLMPQSQKEAMSKTIKHTYSSGSRIHWNIGNNTPIETRIKISKSLLNGNDPALSYYGKDWILSRTTRLQLDNYMCQQCGETEKLEVHHWEPYRFSFDNSIDNLITLCKSCHVDMHRMYISEGFIKEAEDNYYAKNI